MDTSVTFTFYDILNCKFYLRYGSHGYQCFLDIAIFCNIISDTHLIVKTKLKLYHRFFFKKNK